MKFDLNNPRTLATTAVMIALVLALTRIYVPAGSGYIHFGDVAIFFASFAFGPWVGLVAGGVGTALADVFSGGYAHYAPLSLLVHGLQGFVAGLIYRKMVNNAGLLLGWLAGALIVVAGYFTGEALISIYGGLAVALSNSPFNVLQVLVGSVGGVVYLAVVRVYPRLRQSNQ